MVLPVKLAGPGERSAKEVNISIEAISPCRGAFVADLFEVPASA